MQITTSTDGVIELRAHIPKDLLRFQIPGSEPGYSDGAFGQLFSQKVKEPRYTFFHSIYNTAATNITIHAHNNASWLGFRLVLKNHINHIVNGAYPIYLKQGQFSFGYLPVTDSSFDLQKGRIYSTFDMCLDRSLLEDAVQNKKQLKEFFAMVDQGRLVSLAPEARWSNVCARDAVELLMKYPRNEPLAIMLVKCLLKAGLTNPTRVQLTEVEVEALFRAKEHMKENVLNHITIPELARHARINTYLLKNGFYQVFQKTPYQYLLYERLKLAKFLLAETSQRIQAIAAETGFRYDTSLIRAFKREFNQTPHVWRKKNTDPRLPDIYPHI